MSFALVRSRPYPWALALLAVGIVLSIAVGSVFIPPLDVARLLLGMGGEDGRLQTFSVILYQLRLPRTALVGLTGLALAGSGAAYQGLFRNPLADPYLLGIASGAGLGAVLAMTVRWPYTTLGLLAVPLAAFVGAVASVVLVYLLARVSGAAPTLHLVLAGVALGSFSTAVTSFLMLTSSGELRRALAWLLGGATQTGWGPVLAVLPYIALGIGGLALLGHALNVLQFGDEQAHQLGLPVERVRILIIVAASLACAAAVSFSGIIGFVGLVVPHVVRLLCGQDYRRLIPLSAIGGAALLLLADVLSRIVLAPQEVPVGVITALTGAPFFLWLLRRTRQIG